MELSPSWETSSRAVTQEFPNILWNPMVHCLAMFTRAVHWSQSWERRLQHTPPHPISLRSILILPCHLCLGLLPWTTSTPPLLHVIVVLCFIHHSSPRKLSYRISDNMNLNKTLKIGLNRLIKRYFTTHFQDKLQVTEAKDLWKTFGRKTDREITERRTLFL
jgi:hypothetical protein